MKKLLLLISALILGNYVYSQERINSTMPVISQTVLGTLTKADGWMLESNGKWTKRLNRIPQYMEDTEMNLIDVAPFNMGLSNFTSYELRDLSYNDTTYVVLIRKYNDGYWKYPELSKGWTPSKGIEYFIFDKSELSKLDSIKDGKINFITIDLKRHEYIENLVSSQNYINLIAEDYYKHESNKKDNSVFIKKLIFHIAPYKTKNIVQFQIYLANYILIEPDNYKVMLGLDVPGEKLANTIPNHKEGGVFSSGEEVFGTVRLFKNCYYEALYPDFVKFIKIP